MKRIRVIAPFAVFGLILLVLPIPVSGTPVNRSITLTLKQFEFSPGRLEINQGDHVRILLEAEDVVHGFYLDGYGIEQRVVPGVPQPIEFTADRAGKFRFRCSVSCGPLHPFMIGELVVNTNIPFLKALGLVGAALFGMLFTLGKLNPERIVDE